MESTCNHIGVTSADPETLIRFYTEKIGFVREGEKNVPSALMERIFGIDAACRLIKLRFGRVVLEIFDFQTTIVPRGQGCGVGINHWGLEVEDKMSFIRKLRRHSVSLIEAEGKGHTIYFILDPEGNRIEIFERRQTS